MKHDDWAPVALWQDSLFWLGSRREKAFLQYNTYALIDSTTLYVIDPGPDERWARVRPGLEQLLRKTNLDSHDIHWEIILTGSEYEAAGCSSGYGELLLPSGDRIPPRQVHGHWKTGLLLPHAGFQPLSSYQPYIELHAGRRLRMLTLLDGEHSGNIMLQDSLSGALFSGTMFSSMGQGAHQNTAGEPVLLTSAPASRQLGSMRNYLQQLGDQRWTGHLLHAEQPVWDFVPTMVLNRCGLLLNCDPSPLLSALQEHSSPLPNLLAEPSLQPDQQVEELLQEISALQNSNFELQDSLVMLQDERIRDAATGLYNREFFDEYLPLFTNEHQDSAALLLVYLDGLEQLNREHTTAEGDLSIARFAELLRRHKPENGMLFRLGGPVCAILIPRATTDSAIAAAGEIRRAIRNARGFPVTMTCSIGAATVEDTGDARQLRPIAQSRMGYARLQGGDTVCSVLPESVAGNDDQTTRVLLLETDPLTAELIHSYLESNDCRCQVASDGPGAAAALQSFQPHTVVSELFLHGMDAMHLREQLLETAKTPAVPWILYSYHKNTPVITRAHRLGIYHVLKKPIVLPELLGLVRHLTETDRP